MRRRNIELLCGPLLCLLPLLAFADEPRRTPSLDAKIGLALGADREGNPEAALQELGKLIAARENKTRAGELYYVRAGVHSGHRQHEQAIADCTSAIEAGYDTSPVSHLRGTSHFKIGAFDKSIADFDQAIKLEPRRDREHWQRGLSCYYAGRFRDGQRQFEKYQTFQDNDVENVVWAMACQARVDGVPAARKAMLTVREDRRVPMMEIYRLFRGELEPADVMKVAEAGDPKSPALSYQRFYGHLYVGLYYEITGDADKAREHILAADALKNDHYMWDVAHVHAERLRAAAKD